MFQLIIQYKLFILKKSKQVVDALSYDLWIGLEWACNLRLPPVLCQVTLSCLQNYMTKFSRHRILFLIIGHYLAIISCSCQQLPQFKVVIWENIRSINFIEQGIGGSVKTDWKFFDPSCSFVVITRSQSSPSLMTYPFVACMKAGYS